MVRGKRHPYIYGGQRNRHHEGQQDRGGYKDEEGKPYKGSEVRGLGISGGEIYNMVCQLDR